MVNQVLGRVAVVARGAYDPAAEYERLDAVSYQGSAYLVRKHCCGVTPTVGEYYMLMADGSVALDAASKATTAATKANEAAAAAQSVVNTVMPDVEQLKQGLNAEQSARENADNSIHSELNAVADLVSVHIGWDDEGYFSIFEQEV